MAKLEAMLGLATNTQIRYDRRSLCWMSSPKRFQPLLRLASTAVSTLFLLAPRRLTPTKRINEFYKKGCQEKTSASTGGEIFSLHPAHCLLCPSILFERFLLWPVCSSPCGHLPVVTTPVES